MSVTEAFPVAPPNPEPSSRLTGVQTWRNELAVQQGVFGNAGPNIQEPSSLYDASDAFVFCDALGRVMADAPQTKSHKRLAWRLDNVQGDIDEQTAKTIMQDREVRDYLEPRGHDLRFAHQDMVRAWPKFVRLYEAGAAIGIAEGYLPADVIERFQSAIKTSKVQVMDSAMVQVLANSGSTAIYDNVEGAIYLAHGYHTFEAEYIEDLAHEFGHDTSGGTYVLTGEPEQTIYRRRVGYATERPQEAQTYLKTAMNEAFNHHAILGILTGDFANLDPSKRADHNTGYFFERKLWATAVDCSAGFVDLKDLTNGLYEQTGPGGSFMFRKRVLRGMRNAYGWGGITKLELLNKHVGNGKFQESEEQILSRIHAPVLDAEGIVKVQGYIDMEGLPDFFEIMSDGTSYGAVA